MKKQRDPLVGKFFHSFSDDGKVQWQGTVLAKAGDRYLVQLFEWWTGFDNVQKLVPFSEMGNWQFYDCAQAMRDRYLTYDKQHRARVVE